MSMEITTEMSTAITTEAFVSYKVQTPGFQFDNVDILINVNSITYNLTLKTDLGASPQTYMTTLTFKLVNVPTLEEAQNIAERQAKEIYQKICYCYGIKKTELKFSSSTFTLSQNGQTKTQVGMSGYSESTGNFSLSTHVSSLSGSCANLLTSQVSPEKEMYIDHYNFILQSPEPVTQFIFLYHILLDLKGNQGKQQGVESFIKSQEPSVEMIQNPNPGYRNKQETIYTRYRNQIAHKTVDVTIQQTMLKIPSILDGFKKNVRAAIDAIP